MVGEDFPYNEIVPTTDGHKCSSEETDTKEPLHVETCRCQVPSSWHSSSPKYDRYREWTNMRLLAKPVGQSWEYSRYKRNVKEDKPTQHCQRKQKKDNLVRLDIHNTDSTSRGPPSIFPSWKTTNVEKYIMISIAAHFGL